MLFNIHPVKGLSFIIASGLIRRDAGTIAGFLYENNHLSPEYIGKNTIHLLLKGYYIGSLLSLMDNSDINSIFTLLSIKF